MKLEKKNLIVERPYKSVYKTEEGIVKIFFIVYIYCYFFNIIISLFSQVTDPILKIILLETSLYIFHLSLHKKKCNVERCTFSMLNTLSDLQTKTLGYYIFACFIFHNSISGRFLSSHS